MQGRNPTYCTISSKSEKKICSFFCLGATYGGVQRLVLVLCSGITPTGIQGSICVPDLFPCKESISSKPLIYLFSSSAPDHFPTSLVLESHRWMMFSWKEWQDIHTLHITFSKSSYVLQLSKLTCPSRASWNIFEIIPLLLHPRLKHSLCFYITLLPK